MSLMEPCAREVPSSPCLLRAVLWRGCCQSLCLSTQALPTPGTKVPVVIHAWVFGGPRGSARGMCHQQMMPGCHQPRRAL